MMASRPHVRRDGVTGAATRDGIERYPADRVGVAPAVLGGAPPPARVGWGGTA